MLDEFKSETYLALDRGISTNPILHSFQMTANKYEIDKELIESFFLSMESDLCITTYDTAGYNEYIYGSAEVVGLMCLYVFCEGNRELYAQLKPYAQALGAAFQKVNFLRDIKADHDILCRTYFPGVDFNNFTTDKKLQIEGEVSNDFKNAHKGILMLPEKARFGVYVAYKYYLSLFKKIKRTSSAFILVDRIRIPAYSKAFIVMGAGLRNHLNIL
jgi:phytoene/squalene synthetase